MTQLSILMLCNKAQNIIVFIKIVFTCEYLLLVNIFICCSFYHVCMFLFACQDPLQVSDGVFSCGNVSPLYGDSHSC